MSSEAGHRHRALRRRAILLHAALLLAALPGQAGAEGTCAGTATPVVVGGGPVEDACGALAVVSGLDPEGANRLSVRSGPGIRYTRVDLVSTGQPLWVCGRDARWVAVVYAKGDEECGVTTPIDPAIVYDGPCRQGWVFDAYLTFVAG